MANTYLQFLKFSRDLELDKITPRPSDPTSSLLLNEIAVHHFEGKPLSVTQAMELNFIAGPATIHRKVKDLQKAGLIELNFEGVNHRTKYLCPTDAAIQYFQKISAAMKIACMR